MLRISDANTRVKPEGMGYDHYFLVFPVSNWKKHCGVEIITENVKEFEKETKKFKDAKPIVLTTNNYELKRYAAEKALVDFISHNESSSRRDTKTYRFSGVDEALAKACSKSKVSINICFNDFLNSKNKGLILERMRQNVKLCLKYKTPIVVSSGATHKTELVPADNLVAFAEFLGMNKKHARESVSLVAEKIRKK